MSDKMNQDLKHIREMMEQSTRFISLSGKAGVFAGVVGILGAFLGYFIIHNMHGINYFDGKKDVFSESLDFKLLFASALTLFVALIGGVYFTIKKSKRLNKKVWSKATEQLLINVSIPLIAGGIFCLVLYFRYKLFFLISPCMLIFYGLALINGSKYTLHDIRFLGIFEVLLGIIALFYTGYGLVLWGLGFGVLHIVYGVIMHYKYDHKK